MCRLRSPRTDPQVNRLQELGSRAHDFAVGVFNAVVADDWKKLTSPKSTPLDRIEGGLSLGSWFVPEGKLAELAVKAGELAVKAAQLAAEHPEAVAAAAAVIRPFSRTLTDAERAGEFKSFEDFKSFMQPATIPGGPERDWHHVVEKYHADGSGQLGSGTGQFTPEQVHNIENLVPLEKGPHRGPGGISSEFTTFDERLQAKPRSRQRSTRAS